ncbi:hypothetical protein B0H17DRAFT_1125627 [Mycena rosella]|uniref:Reverse transcriptase n=1 Tax=Mycena rosella TaxID=1033263 RepID=A0AAD7M9P7_MYCRO|nr:hypothetical protein B0H17DRAFT_1125627 [Mycena rosella]
MGTPKTTQTLGGVNSVLSGIFNVAVNYPVSASQKELARYSIQHLNSTKLLRRKGIPLQYVKWVTSFLQDRQVTVWLDGVRGKMKPVENGILAQGSPVSSIPASFYSSGHLEKFEKKGDLVQHPLPLPDDPTDTNLIIYVDDGKLT